jgi:ketosteroid isomerase-like protein
MPSLTPAALVAELHDGMRSGSVPSFGEPITMDEGIPRFAAALAPFAHPEFVCLMVGSRDVVGTFAGVAGIEEGWRDWGETFSVLTVHLEEIREVPVGAMILAKQVGVTRHGAIDVEQPSAMVLRLRDGSIGSIEFHLDRELAEEAAAG